MHTSPKTSDTPTFQARLPHLALSLFRGAPMDQRAAAQRLHSTSPGEACQHERVEGAVDVLHTYDEALD